METPYNILSLDGGGSWALIQVKCLRQLFGDTEGTLRGHEVLRKFNLAVSNSGGSIVLAGLMCNFKLADLELIFLDQTQRETIFKARKKGPFERVVNLIPGLKEVVPRYDAEEKLKGFKAAFAMLYNRDTAICHSADQSMSHFGTIDNFPDVVIMGFDYQSNRGTFFRTRLMSRADTSGIFNDASLARETSLVEAVHVSSNAPIQYFDRPASINVIQAGKSKLLYGWDGAIGGYNNPAMAGIIEAVANGVSLGDIRLLSIGTGTVTEPRGYALEDGKYVKVRMDANLAVRTQRDIPKMAKSILADPPDASSFAAVALLYPGLNPAKVAEGGRFIRLNPMLRPLAVDNPASVLHTTLWDISPQNVHIFSDKYAQPVPPFQALADGTEPRTLEECLKALAGMDMDAVQQEDVRLINRFCEAWFKGWVPNQFVRAGKNGEDPYGHILGHDRFADAKAAFQRWQL